MVPGSAPVPCCLWWDWGGSRGSAGDKCRVRDCGCAAEDVAGSAEICQRDLLMACWVFDDSCKNPRLRVSFTAVKSLSSYLPPLRWFMVLSDSWGVLFPGTSLLDAPRTLTCKPVGVEKWLWHNIFQSSFHVNGKGSRKGSGETQTQANTPPQGQNVTLCPYIRLPKALIDRESSQKEKRSPAMSYEIYQIFNHVICGRVPWGPDVRPNARQLFTAALVREV